MPQFPIPDMLTDGRYSVSRMVDSDRAALTAAAADPQIWAGHPARDRWKPEVFGPYLDFLLSAGGAVTLRDGNRVIGCSRFYPVPDQPDGIGIGFTFLTRDSWGGAVNRRIKRLMHAHAFAVAPEVWYHIALDNLRSQKATAKLGAVFAYEAHLTLGPSPARWNCYRLIETDWRAADSPVRKAAEEDIPELTALLATLVGEDPTDADIARARLDQLALWPGSAVWLAEDAGRIVATCTLVVLPNLTRGGRPRALIENVVTAADARGRGHGRRVLMAAVDAAWEAGCFQVLLATGSKDPGVHEFYSACGFGRGKVAYEIRRVPALEG